MRIKKGQENGAKKIGINNEMNANDMRLSVPTKGYMIFLYSFFSGLYDTAKQIYVMDEKSNRW